MRAVGTVTTHALTSTANQAFVEGLGYFDRVCPYAGVPEVDMPGPVVFLDLTRNLEVVSAVHQRLAGRLVRSVMVGGTHTGQPMDVGALPGPTPQRFFAPDADEAQLAGYEAAEDEFVRDAGRWLRAQEQSGPEAMANVFRTLLHGRQDPSVAFVLRPG